MCLIASVLTDCLLLLVSLIEDFFIKHSHKIFFTSSWVVLQTPPSHNYEFSCTIVILIQKLEAFCSSGFSVHCMWIISSCVYSSHLLTTFSSSLSHTALAVFIPSFINREESGVTRRAVGLLLLYNTVWICLPFAFQSLKCTWISHLYFLTKLMHFSANPMLCPRPRCVLLHLSKCSVCGGKNRKFNLTFPLWS